jgi:hypothetical protein
LPSNLSLCDIERCGLGGMRGSVGAAMAFVVSTAYNFTGLVIKQKKDTTIPNGIGLCIKLVTLQEVHSQRIVTKH